MIYTSLEEALDYAKKNKVPSVLEMRCPRCDKTVYAATDDQKHEHLSWLEGLRANRNKSHVACRRCGYGSLSSAEGGFVFKTHDLGG
ncbi:MAG: hypothetical protein Q7S36_00550 [Candidatus Liptonbacteria bacterium]|nr:hypothetical protein [Candidatus Liptonbacteria bacterium]